MLNACPTAIDFDVYQPRNPKASAYYRCVEDHFEQLETVWDECYQSRFGFWRPYVTDVIQRYLDCGDLHFGFARVKCEDCGHEYLLADSCKRRHFFKRKPPARANDPPAQAIIIFDDSSVPDADAYLIRLRRIIQLKPTFKKIQLRA